MATLFANSGDPDQTPRSAASDLGLHCFPNTLLGSPDYNRLILRICNSMSFINVSHKIPHFFVSMYLEASELTIVMQYNLRRYEQKKKVKGN